MKSVIIIGNGYWGKKILRNIQSIKKYNIYVFDPLIKKKSKNENICFINKLENFTPDYLFIITPVKYHLNYINKFNNRKTKIFVEKPMLMNTQIKSLNNRYGNIFTGYVYLYNKFILNLKKKVNKESSKPLFIKFERKNLGPIRKDVDVLYDLASHDLSIINFIFDDSKIKLININKGKYLQSLNGINDYYFIELLIDNKIKTFIEVNWINPVKERKISVFFKNKIILFDEVENKITQHKISKFFYEKTLLNIDNLKLNTKVSKYKNNNPLKKELMTFLSSNKNEFEFNYNIATKTQKILDKIFTNL